MRGTTLLSAFHVLTHVILRTILLLTHYVDEKTEAREIKYAQTPPQGYTASMWGLNQVYQNTEAATNKPFCVCALGYKCMCTCELVHGNLCPRGSENTCVSVWEGVPCHGTTQD